MRFFSLPSAVIALGLAVVAGVSPASAQPPVWEEIGPYGVGGRVSALALDPGNSSRAIAGTPAGGLWRTTDGGATWTGMTLWLASVPISAVAIDPGNPNRVFVGTGTLSDAGAVSGGAGVIVTTDGGVSWQMQNIGVTGAFVSSIVLWPGEPNRVLIATDLGIRMSTDGGATYVPALDGQAVSTIVPDPLQAGVAFATGRTGLFRSDDKGASWALVNAWPLLPTDNYGAGTTALAVSATTPGVLFATVQVLRTLDVTDRALLLRSTNGGQSFTALTAPANFCPAGTAACGFGHALAIDPANGSRLLLGGDRLYRSTSSGDTWTEVAGAPGVHQIALLGGTTMVAGRFGVATVNGGWSATTRRNNGLAIAAVTSVDVSLTAGKIAVGTADSGLAVAPLDSAAWQVAFAPDEPVGASRFDPFDGSRLLTSRSNGRIYRSTDGGVTFAPAQTGLDMNQSAVTFAPLVPSTVQPGIWYTGRLQLFKSSDNASNWAGFRPPGFPEISTLSASPVAVDRLYFTSGIGGSVYKVDGIGVEQLPVTSDANLFVTSILPDPLVQNVLYVGGLSVALQSGRIFKSSDFGVTWTDVSPPGLAPVTSLLKDAYGALYAGTRNGLFRSANDGFSWTPFTNGMLAGGVSVLHRGTGWLYAGTNGRGVFRVRELPLISIESIPDKMKFLVDGQLVTGPYFTYAPAGTTHTIAPQLTNTADTHEEFLGWLDGGPQNRTVTATDSNVWLMANIKRSFRLSASGTPSSGGSVEFVPASADAFYAEQSFVTVVPVPAPDYRVAGFTGEASGNDGLLAFAVMDRPRTIAAQFEPLRMTVKADVPGITVKVDGVSVAAPATFQWNNASIHTLEAPEFVGTNPYLPSLAFDAWSNLQSRAHSFTVTRDTFVTDFTAHYISTLRGVQMLAASTAFLTTTGSADAPRLAALTQIPDGGNARPQSMQFVRGTVGGVTTTEFALVPSAAQTWTNVKVDQDRDGTAGRLRVSLFNPGGAPVSVGLLLRDSGGNVQAAQIDALVLEPKAHTVEWLDELMPLPPAFTSLLTIIGSGPLVTSVHNVRGNFRTPAYAYDPVLVVPFVPGDYGVPVDARVQTAILTPNTTHRFTLINIGFSPLAGAVEFRNAAGAAMPLDLGQGPTTGLAYSLGPGAFQTVTFQAAGAGDPFATLQLLVTPAAGQPAPAIQMQEERSFGSVDGQPTILPRVIPPSMAAHDFAVPIHRGRRETGLVFTNTSPFTVTVMVRVLGLDGVMQRSEMRSVPPFQQLTLSSEAVAGTLGPAFAGQLSVNTDIPVHVVGYLRLTNERGEETVAGFPSITTTPTPATSGLALQGDSWRSEWWFINPGGSPLKTQLDFRGRKGAVVYFPIE